MDQLLVIFCRLSFHLVSFRQLEGLLDVSIQLSLMI